MTQFQYTQRTPGYTPYAEAARAYRASQEGVPPFTGRYRSQVPRSSSATRSGSATPASSRRVSDPAVARAYEALWLKPGAPMSVVKAAYRSLAAQTHPDVGGDPSAMLRLNTAYETLRRSLG